jgi:hypothetical protein
LKTSLDHRGADHPRRHLARTWHCHIRRARHPRYSAAPSIRSLHDSVFIVNVITELTPYVAEENRTEVPENASQVWRFHAHYGFMEQPDLPALLTCS